LNALQAKIDSELAISKDQSENLDK